MTSLAAKLITSTLFGAGYVGLRALATGLPGVVLARIRGARSPTMQRRACGDAAKAQFIILTPRARAIRSTPTCPGPTTIRASRTAPIPRWPPTPLTLGGHAHHGRGAVGDAAADGARPH